MRLIRQWLDTRNGQRLEEVKIDPAVRKYATHNGWMSIDVALRADARTDASMPPLCRCTPRYRLHGDIKCKQALGCVTRREVSTPEWTNPGVAIANQNASSVFIA